MGFMRRRRVKPPIQVYGPPSLSTVTVELSGSWVVSYVGNVQEQRRGPSYKWTPQLTHTYRQALMHVLNHQFQNIKVSGATATSITLHASGEIHPQRIKEIRTAIEQAEAISITASQQPVAV